MVYIHFFGVTGNVTTGYRGGWLEGRARGIFWGTLRGGGQLQDESTEVARGTEIEREQKGRKRKQEDRMRDQGGASVLLLAQWL